MISNLKWLALAATLVLFDTSCLHTQRVRHQHALAVKAEAEADLAHAQADAVRHSVEENEYVEATTPPEIPQPLQEARPTAPSSSHVWIAGHHTRRDGAWVWVPGHYALPPRNDVVWVPGHWVNHRNGYVWIGGAWR